MFYILHIFSEVFYVRNHLPVPVIDIDDYELEIEMEDSDKTITLKMDDLKKFPKITIPVTIMCAGNRRSDMNKVKYFDKHVEYL